jgi:hypothetical protein
MASIDDAAFRKVLLLLLLVSGLALMAPLIGAAWSHVHH